MEAFIDQSKIYTVAQVADLLGYSKLTILRAIRDGRLKALCPGGMSHGKRYRITGTDLASFLMGDRDKTSEAEAMAMEVR